MHWLTPRDLAATPLPRRTTVSFELWCLILAVSFIAGMAVGGSYGWLVGLIVVR